MIRIESQPTDQSIPPSNHPHGVLFHPNFSHQYKAFSISAASWPPKFTKAEFVFEGGVHLAYCDPRRWGRITVRVLACFDFSLTISWGQSPPTTPLVAADSSRPTPFPRRPSPSWRPTRGRRCRTWRPSQARYRAAASPSRRCCWTRTRRVPADMQPWSLPLPPPLLIANIFKT